MTRSELATWIVRVCEKYPDRVGFRGNWGGPGPGGRCIIGQCHFEATRTERPFPILPSTVYGFGYIESVRHIVAADPVAILAGQAATLNDHRVPWGEIPKLLGLVPGELAAEAASSPAAALDGTRATAGAELAPNPACRPGELVTA